MWLRLVSTSSASRSSKWSPRSKTNNQAPLDHEPLGDSPGGLSIQDNVAISVEYALRQADGNIALKNSRPFLRHKTCRADTANRRHTTVRKHTVLPPSSIGAHRRLAGFATYCSPNPSLQFRSSRFLDRVACTE